MKACFNISRCSLLLVLGLMWSGMLSGQTTAINEWIRLPKPIRSDIPLYNLSWQLPEEPKIAVVLSGGGARGFSHIGVLKALEEHQVPVNLIVGTSIGAIIGGFYAAGFSADEIRDFLSDINWDGLFADRTYRTEQLLSQKRIPRRHFIQIRLDGVVPTLPTSVTQGQQLFQTLYNLLIRANFQAAGSFDHLRIPFRAVATDLISGNRVVLDRGDLAEAINASMAFPIMFAPVEIEGSLLVDGGITDNLPVDVAFQEAADYVIAADATSPLRKKQEVINPIEIADQVTTIMMAGKTRESLAKADMVIKPVLNGHKGAQFNDFDMLIEQGYKRTIQLIDSLNQDLRRLSAQTQSPGRLLGRCREVRIRGVDIRDNVLLTSLQKSLQGRDIYPALIQEILREIHATGLFEDEQAHISGDKDALMLTFHLIEQPYVKSVTFRHTGIAADSLLTPIRQSLAGKPLNMLKAFGKVKGLKSALIGQGYALAEIEHISYTSRDSTLIVTIDEGYVHEVRVSGNDRTRDFVVLREFPLKADSLFQSEKAIRGIQNIYSTALFDRVLLNLERNGQQNILNIKVKERRYSVARLGARFSLERQSAGFVEYLEDNWLGTGVKASVFGGAGDFGRRAEASLYTIRLLNTFLTSRASVYYEERQDRYSENFERLADYQTIRRGGIFQLGQQIDRLGLISAEIKMESINLMSGDSLFPFQEDIRLRSFVLRSVVDKRDKLPFPDRGIYNRWYWEVGNQGQPGSSVRFTKLFLGLEGYYPLFPWLNYHPFIYAGSADLTLPFTEYFFFGGDQNFPGLHERERFGRQILNTGVELRARVNLRLPFETFLLTRYNVGAAWLRPDDKIQGSDFLHALSGSFALNTLIGPVILTWSRVSNGRSRVDFSMGFDF